jgi:hypothetical protein
LVGDTTACVGRNIGEKHIRHHKTSRELFEEASELLSQCSYRIFNSNSSAQKVHSDQIVITFVTSP